MPIDASIPLQVRQVQLQDPTEVMGRVMNLRTLAGQQQLQQMQLQQAQQQQEQERTLADLYRGNINPDGTVNRQGILGAAAEKGLGARIPGLQKQFADADEATAKVGKLKSETGEIDFNVAKKRMDASAAAINSLVANPNVTHQDVIATMVSLVNQGIVTPEQGQQAIRELPGRPEQLRPFLMQKGLQVMDAAKRMEMLQPKLEKVDNGGQISFVDTNVMTNPQGPAPVTRVATPGERLQASTTMRGQNLTDARARETNQLTREANANVYDPERGVLVNKATGLARPAATMNGQPIGAKPKDLTDAQAKALLFGTRMQEADAALGKLASTGTDMPSIIKTGAERTPLVGGLLGPAANAVAASPAQQQVEQAQRDFINAVLRRESGAVISESEFDNARKQYFPQVGDSAAVKKQKADNRRRATQLMMEEVPATRRSGGNAPNPPTPAAGAIDFQLPSDIQAILNKHGAR
jgi:hypothetical protein